MYLLFINSLKGLTRKKIQIIGIVLLILLSTSIYTALSLAASDLDNSYQNYKNSQNVLDYGLEPVIDYKTDYTYEEVANILNTKLKDISIEQKSVINMYLLCLKTDPSTCVTDMLSTGVNSIFNLYGVNYDKSIVKMNELSNQYNFTYDYEETKLFNDNKYNFKAILLKDKELNKPYLLEGKIPSEDNEIAILKNFASKNKININDDYKIGDKTYKVVGFMYASDHIYPLISLNNPFYQEEYNTTVFMNEKTYNEFNGFNINDFVIRFNDRNNVDGQMEKILKDQETGEKKVNLSMWNVLSILRVKQPEMEFKNNKLFAKYFMYLLLGISVIVISIIAKKRIDDERTQIGVLKSLGYKSNSIAISYLVYPVIGSVIGGILGYFLGVMISPILKNLYLSYYAFPIIKYNFNLEYLYSSILIPLILLSLLTYLISMFMLRHKPLYLLREGSNLKVNFISRMVTKAISKLNFYSRFKYSIAFRSIGKLTIISLTSFFTGLLITLTLIGSNLFSSMIDKTFSNFRFDYMINYRNDMKENGDSEGYVYQLNVKFSSIKNSNNENKEITEKDKDINIIGIKNDMKYLDIIDDKKKNLTNLLDDKSILINKNIKEIFEINIGDKVELYIDDIKMEYTVAGVVDNYFGLLIYSKKSTLLNNLSLDESLYNRKYTKDSKYSNNDNIDKDEMKSIANILSIKDLKENMENQIKTMNGMIYFIIIFSGIMSFIIIGVVANIVVEENKKTISLMKVMGYNKKDITKIVLNIYTPFVIVSYLISIPVMITVLKFIVKILSKDMSFSIPISISPFMGVIGLISLLIGYYIAIFLSKRSLDKVPLSLALKRE